MGIEFYGNFDDEARQILLSEIKTRTEAIVFSKLEIGIYFNFPEGTILDNSKFNVLFLQEPKSVLPWQYQSKILNQFQLVIPFGPWRAKVLGIPHWVFMPYNFTRKVRSLEANRSIWLSMINAAKFSSGQTSNYGLRRMAIKKLSKENIDFRLYGWDWDAGVWHELQKRMIALRASFVSRENISFRETISTPFSKFKVYQGGVLDKSEVLRQSELTLIIENDSDYVTEKLFDAFTCGAVPIYIGPSFTEWYPEIEDCIFRSNSDVESIIEIVIGITPEDILSRRRAIENLILAGSLVEHFGYQEIWRKAAKIIIEHQKKI